jgi:monodehydroascorbate reductase (NADH)
VSADISLSHLFLSPDPARLPGFHACVGGGGARQEAAWYADHGIDYLTGRTVTGVDLGARVLTLAGGSGDGSGGGGEAPQTLSFDRLVAATGARPVNLAADFRTPGADLAGIHYLRNVADADALVAALAALKEGQASGGDSGEGEGVVVVGGGYIGAEAAAALVAWAPGTITAVFPESRLMERILSPAASSFYEAFYEAKGVRLVKGKTAVSFQAREGGGSAAAAAALGAVTLSDGASLPAALCIVGVGARPVVDVLAAAGAATLAGPPGGLAVDATLQSTSHPGLLWGVGDVAAFPSACCVGSSEAAAGGAASPALTRLEHVNHARSSAAHVARALFGGGEGGAGASGVYLHTPYFYSRVFSLAWVAYGSVGPGPGMVAVDFGGATAEAGAAAAAAADGGPAAVFGTWWVRGGTVVGGFLEGGSPEDGAALKAAVEAQPPAPADLADQGLAFARAVAARL